MDKQVSLGPGASYKARPTPREFGKQGLFNNTRAKSAKDKFAGPEDIETHHIFQAKHGNHFG